MRDFPHLKTALAACASVMSLVLWYQLHAEREVSASLRQRVADAESRIMSAASMATGVVADSAAAGGTNAPIPARVPAISAVARAIPPLPGERDMLKDPDYRKARLAQMRLRMPDIYPGLAEALGLSPEQSDKFFDLLLQGELDQASNNIVPGPDGLIDTAQLQAQQMAQREAKAKQEAALASMLGNAGYARWQEYQQTQSARQQVNQLGRTLAAAGMPLTSAQMKPLIDAVVAEQSRLREDRRATLINAPARTLQASEVALDRQAESNRRILDVAAGHLDARQLELFRASLEAQLGMNRATSRLKIEADAARPVAAPTELH